MPETGGKRSPSLTIRLPNSPTSTSTFQF
jgi:hypothetical protein